MLVCVWVRGYIDFVGVCDVGKLGWKGILGHNGCREINDMEREENLSYVSTDGAVGATG